MLRENTNLVSPIFPKSAQKMKIPYITHLRKFGNSHPNIRKLLMPLVASILKHSWLLRNILTWKSPVIVKTRQGSVSMIAEGQIAEMLWRYDFEAPERAYINDCIRAGMRVINVGANAGLYALMASRLAGESGEVHAFEPATENFGRLQQNVKDNHLKNVTCEKVAISNRVATIGVFRDLDNPLLDAHFSVHSEDVGEGYVESIKCTTLDEYWECHSEGRNKPVDLLIIDVEGHELEVFQGARQLLASSPNLLIMAECTVSLEEINLFLKNLGFGFYTLDPQSNRLQPSDIKRGNMFACRSTN